MRIGYVFTKYPVFEQTYLWREVRELRKNGIDVRTFSIRRPRLSEVKSEVEQEECNSTHYLNNSKPISIAWAHLRLLAVHPINYVVGLIYSIQLSQGGIRANIWQLFYFLEAVCLVEWARNNGVNHIHVHMIGSACSMALIASKCGEITYSLTAHGQHIFDNCKQSNLREKFLQAKGVICISHYCRSQVMRNSPPEHWGKIQVIHLGVDLSQFLNDKINSDRERKHINILTVGRIDPEKGQRILVNALAVLRRKKFAFRCVIVGNGPDIEPLRKSIVDLGLEPYVHLTGSASEREVKEFCESADLFVLPSLAEGIPVVLMEAMAMQLAVISTRVMGIPELVEEGMSGILVAPGNEKSLGLAIERLAADSILRWKLGIAGKQKIASEYDIMTNTEQLRTFLRKCLDTGISSNRD